MQSSKKLKTEKKSKKDKKDKKDKRSKKDGKKDKEDSVTARLRKSMLEALYPEKVGGKTALSDEEKKAMMLEQNKDKLYKKVGRGAGRLTSHACMHACMHSHTRVSAAFTPSVSSLSTTTTTVYARTTARFSPRHQIEASITQGE